MPRGLSSRMKCLRSESYDSPKEFAVGQVQKIACVKAESVRDFIVNRVYHRVFTDRGLNNDRPAINRVLLLCCCFEHHTRF